MATVTTCDSAAEAACSEAEIRRISVLVDDLELAADLCASHRAELCEKLMALGFRVVSTRSNNRKRRAVYEAKSGAKFSAAEARAWLREQGDLEAAKGRLRQEDLDRYAAAH